MGVRESDNVEVCVYVCMFVCEHMCHVCMSLCVNELTYSAYLLSPRWRQHSVNIWTMVYRALSSFPLLIYTFIPSSLTPMSFLVSS